eukprot:m.86386 g.86386  ORF g.86386 m.86386 type:complete len:226 (-) comp12804_c0_seq2:2242-2919(-)
MSSGARRRVAGYQPKRQTAAASSVPRASRSQAHKAQRPLQRTTPQACTDRSSLSRGQHLRNGQGAVRQAVQQHMQQQGQQKQGKSQVDSGRVKSRLKQIGFGKNTQGYINYIKQVDRAERKAEDPQTPDPYRDCSKRAFDGLIRKWRQQLHQYDAIETSQQPQEQQVVGESAIGVVAAEPEEELDAATIFDCEKDIGLDLDLSSSDDEGGAAVEAQGEDEAGLWG